MARKLGGTLANLLFVFYCTAVGVFLLLRPWAPAGAARGGASGFLRGFVSGLGLLHLIAAWLDARELMRRRGGPPGPPPT